MISKTRSKLPLLFFSIFLIGGILYLLIGIPMVVSYVRAEKVSIHDVMDELDGIRDSWRKRTIVIEGILEAGDVHKIFVRTYGLFPLFEYELSATEHLRISDQTGVIILSTEKLKEPNVQGVDPYRVDEHVVALVQLNNEARLIGIRRHLPSLEESIFSIFLWTVTLTADVALIGLGVASIKAAYKKGKGRRVFMYSIGMALLFIALSSLIAGKPF